ncbi:MAG: hypothetical protein WKF97_13865 [Chitinophagaceae bacterium]
MSTKFNPFEKEHTGDMPAGTELNLPGIQYQQKLLLEHLRNGNTINFLQARDMGIGYLNSRIADLRKEITIHSRFIRISNVKCKEYSLAPFEETSIDSAKYDKSIIASRRTG